MQQPVKSTLPTRITVTLGSTQVAVEISARYVLSAEASKEIHELVARIARLATPDND